MNAESLARHLDRVHAGDDVRPASLFGTRIVARMSAYADDENVPMEPVRVQVPDL